MARDITIRVTGQNPDGTLNVSQVGGDGGNPFSTVQSGAMVPYNPGAAQPATTGGYKAKLGNVEVTFASEADYLKADREIQMMTAASNVPILGGYGGAGGAGSGRGTAGWLRTGADAAQTVGAFLAARGIRRKIEDVRDALSDGERALSELDVMGASGKYADLIPVLRRAFVAERDATESHISAMDDEITALDIQTGAGVARVVGEFMGDRPSVGSLGDGGIGTALAVGGAGLGLGLLVSNNNSNNNSDRRRRR